MNCPKCTGLVVPKWGWSDNDLRGMRYQYLSCVCCGWVRHLLTAQERRERTAHTGYP